MEETVEDKLDAVERVRSANNRLWMELLRLALWYAPKEARQVLAQINANDKRISGLLEGIANADPKP